MAYYVRQRARKDGTTIPGWQCVHHRPSPGKPGKRITQSKTFEGTREGKKQANAWGVDMERRYARNRHYDPQADKTTFATLAEQWQIIAKPRLAPRSYRRVSNILANHLLPEFGDAQVGDISRQWVRDYLSKLAASTQPEFHLDGTRNGHAGKPYAPATVTMVATWFSGVLEEGVERGYIESNPARGVMRKGKIARRQAKPLIDALTAAEIHALADAMPTPAYRVAVLTAGFTGMRASELWAVRRQDVDLMRGRITVERSIKRWTGGDAEFGTTKTDKVRTVELAPELQTLLASHLTPTSPTATPDPDALVFTRKDGHTVRHETWYRDVYQPAAAKALPHHPHLHFHTLRHSYATMLLRAGVNPVWVAKQGGWASTKVLLDTYAHAMPEDDDRGRGVLSEAFQSATSPNVVKLREDAA